MYFTTVFDFVQSPITAMALGYNPSYYTLRVWAKTKETAAKRDLGDADPWPFFVLS